MSTPYCTRAWQKAAPGAGSTDGTKLKNSYECWNSDPWIVSVAFAPWRCSPFKAALNKNKTTMIRIWTSMIARQNTSYWRTNYLYLTGKRWVSCPRIVQFSAEKYHSGAPHIVILHTLCTIKKREKYARLLTDARHTQRVLHPCHIGILVSSTRRVNNFGLRQPHLRNTVDAGAEKSCKSTYTNSSHYRYDYAPLFMQYAVAGVKKRRDGWLHRKGYPGRSSDQYN